LLLIKPKFVHISFKKFVAVYTGWEGIRALTNYNGA